MFTGIVEELARVESVRKSGTRSFAIQIDVGKAFGSTLALGDSIAVNGVCLTVTGRSGGVVSCDVITETLQKTNLGDLRRGSHVNIERSLSLSDRLSGHLVSGHVNGTGSVKKLESQEDGSTKVWVNAPTGLLALMVQKGSVAVDGVSLTLVNVSRKAFSFCLIPHTFSATTLGRKKLGSTVNVEVNMISKLVKRFVQDLDLKGGPAK